MENISEKMLQDIGDSFIKINHSVKQECSLFLGSVGKVIYLSYLYNFTKKNKYLDEVVRLIENMFDLLNDREVSSNLISGYAGFGWAVQHLINIGTLSKEVEENLYQIDEIIIDSLKRDEIDKNCDLLYGIVGKGIYLLERNNDHKFDAELKNISNIIIGFSVSDLYGVSWREFNADKYGFEDSKFKNCKYFYNIGLAHGIPSIISFLSLLHKKGINKSDIKITLESAARWLMANKLKSKLNSYPNYINNHYESNNDGDRLSWCYGDLSVAICMFHVYNVTKNNVYYDHGIEVAKKAARRNLEQSGVFFKRGLNTVDTSFCHGTIGLYHIFRRIGDYTNDKNVIDAAEYWKELSIAQRLDCWRGVSGFVKYHLNEDFIYTMTEIDTSILEGTSGVAMVMLDDYYDNKNDWDAIFLTNI